jgi:S-adenosylmethionine synthetase
VIRPVLGEKYLDKETTIYVNPTGRFVVGGPQGDCGLTGRKIIVDTYGGMGRHGGGAFSGKDPVQGGPLRGLHGPLYRQEHRGRRAGGRCEVQLAYAIGVAQPVSVMIDTAGTETLDVSRIELLVREFFDMRPASIISRLDLLRPIFRQTAAYGHFGRSAEDFSWERLDMVDSLRKAAG